MIPAEFWSRADVRGPDDCWAWTGAVGGPSDRPAPTVYVPGRRMQYVSRMVVEWAGGVHERTTRYGHTCGHTWCVNPSHIRATTAADRFWSKVDKDGPIPDPAIYGDIGPCWVWTGATVDGYGHSRWNRCHRGTTRCTHIALELVGRTIGPMVLHSCDNRLCVNPAHLRAGTAKDNASDMMARGRHSHRGMAGSSNPMAKLTQEQANEIRSTVGTCAAVGRQFGVSRSMVSLIRTGRAWARLDTVSSEDLRQ